MFQFKDMDYLRDGDLYLQLMRKAPENREEGHVPSYIYRIFKEGIEEQIGSIDIRIGFNENIRYGGHIGYTIYKKYRGHHYAARACEIIKQVALAHEMDQLLITCNPDNWASRKTCERLGAILVEIIDLPPGNDMYREGERQKCLYCWQIN